MPVGATLLAPANGKSVRIRRGRAAVMDLFSRESICSSHCRVRTEACDGKAKIRGGPKPEDRPAGKAIGMQWASHAIRIRPRVSGTAGNKLACAIAPTVERTVPDDAFRKRRRF